MANRDLSRNRRSTTRGEDHDPRSRRLDHGIHVHRAGGAHYLRPRVGGRRRRLGRSISPPKATTFIAEETLTGNCPAAFPRSRSCLSASASVSVRPLASLFILETIVCGGDTSFPCCPNLVGLRWGGRLLQEGSSRPFPFFVVSARELISRPSFLWRFPQSRPGQRRRR